jgi:nucleotide-binding universal stress UspA family protein
MFQRILVPLDGSALAERALDYGADAVSRYGARLVLLRAFAGPERTSQMLVPTPPVITTFDPKEASEVGNEAKAESQTYLANHWRTLVARGLAVEVLVADADAAEAILEVAQWEPDTLIVMSTRGRGGLGRLVFGSVAQTVLERTPVPLLLIPAEIEEPSSPENTQVT